MLTVKLHRPRGGPYRAELTFSPGRILDRPFRTETERTEYLRAILDLTDHRVSLAGGHRDLEVTRG
jgi:hypothetical protein